MEPVNPLVSIVVITYNSSKYVLETLESAKAQTYQNIELIISDDCSIDNTVKICKNWLDENGERFVQTELITVEKNTGIAPNCNRGCKMAKGEWVKLIAGDDILLNDCIYNNIDYIDKEHGVNALFSNISVFNSGYIPDEKKLHDVNPSKIKYGFLVPPKEQLYILLNVENFISAPTSFIRKKVFDKYGYYDERYPFIEDVPMWINLSKHGIKLHFMPKITVLYRKGDSISSPSKKIINEQLHLSREAFKKSLKNDPLLPKRNLRIRVLLEIESVKNYILIYIFKNKRNKLTLSVNYCFKYFFWVIEFLWKPKYKA